MEAGTHFVYKDAFNELRWEGKTWEVAHPMIFQQLVSKQRRGGDHWRLLESDAPMLHGLYYTLLNVQTALGFGTVWVFVEHPELFNVPELDFTGEEEKTEALWDWWLQWSQHPILISCPIRTVVDETPSYSSWTIRSIPFFQNNGVLNMDSHDPLVFYPFYAQGCYTIASGQTMMMAMHRLLKLNTYAFLSVLSKWKHYYIDNEMAVAGGGGGGDGGDDEAEALEMVWMMVFNTKTLLMLQYTRTNTLIGDHLPLYATYGHTSPIILSFFFQSLALLTPVLPHIVEQPTTLLINYIPYYMKLMTLPRGRKRYASRRCEAYPWFSNWSIVKPFLNRMSVSQFRSPSQYPAPIHVYLPDQAFLESILDLHVRMRKTMDFNPLTEYIRFIQSEFGLGSYRMAHRLFDSTFKRSRPASKDALYTFWSYLKHTFFESQHQWLEWLERFFTYYTTHTRTTIPWRFLHWAFDADLTAFKKLGGSQKSLFDCLKLFKHHDAPQNTPELFRKHVLLPRIQARLRILYQLKRELPNGIHDVFGAYLGRHLDILWR